jgi:hypothetical protein
MSSGGINWQFIMGSDDEDTDEIPLPAPLTSFGRKSGWSVDNMVFIKVCLYEDQADDYEAIRLALEEMKSKVTIPLGLNKTSIVERDRRILFTSIQIEYTIELIVSKDAAKMYYDTIA